jgi:hypothetical protein
MKYRTYQIKKESLRTPFKLKTIKIINYLVSAGASAAGASAGAASGAVSSTAGTVSSTGAVSSFLHAANAAVTASNNTNFFISTSFVLLL